MIKEKEYIKNGIKFKVKSNEPSNEVLHNFAKKLIEITKGIE